jgi:hypothetical protein
MPFSRRSSRLMSVKKGMSERLMIRAVSPCSGRLAAILSNDVRLKGRYSRMAGLWRSLGCSARFARLCGNESVCC